MKRYLAGSVVPGGFYFGVSRWNISAVSGRQGTLEGVASDRYVRLPLPIMLVVCVLVSLAYVTFVPFVGFVILAAFILRAAAAGAKRLAEEVLATVAPRWRPDEAHLAGKADDEDGDEKAGAGFEALRKEVSKERDAKEK
jgi:hypothetical protein